MTILRVGSTEKYSENFDQAFGKKKRAGKKVAASATAKKKVAKKKTAKKKKAKK